MSHVYINLSTMEYPRHVGDIELDPEGQYAPVEIVDEPIVDNKVYNCYEDKPINVDGIWKMVWIVELRPEPVVDPNQGTV